MALELTPPQADLYTSVSINPPSASQMTICYGFVCRRRAILEFSSADHAALTQILAAGRASPAAERAALQKQVAELKKKAPNPGRIQGIAAKLSGACSRCHSNIRDD